jgi:hypothetical protein
MGAEILLARRVVAPPILKSDMMSSWMWGKIVAKEEALEVVVCLQFASHDTAEYGLAGLGLPTTRRARFVPPSSSISFLWFTCAAN